MLTARASLDLLLESSRELAGQGVAEVVEWVAVNAILWYGRDACFRTGAHSGQTVIL